MVDPVQQTDLSDEKDGSVGRERRSTTAQPEQDGSSFSRKFGAGLISGAADDDPSGIATYSQVGAQFGFALGWTILFCYPFLVGVQGLSARIGAVTGQGLARNLRRHYPASLARVATLMLLIANVINIGADLAAMGAALQLLAGGPQLVYAVTFGIVCVLLEIFVRYRRYATFLKWLTLSLFAYVAVVFAVDVPWMEAARGIFVPSFTFGGEQATALVAVLGTTVSPYLLFWQAGQEVEELERRHHPRLGAAPQAAGSELVRIEIDTIVGMALSGVVALSIMIATAATLHANGTPHIETSAQAAEALRPVAGNVAFALFAAGIIGTGMLAVPVLAGSAAYAVAELFQWPEGLDRAPRRAKAFYGTIALATLGSAIVFLVGVDPFLLLYWSAVINGMLAGPLIAIMTIMAANRRIMGQLKAPWWMLTLGGATALVMLAATAGLFLL
ncbi:Nramp family divalent metal transporter [Ensifer sp. SSB1]|jgi:NRAMP (natural resistance-associated macrophage protein)-like metal ion transporter|uniref:Nramp family divalent metal transporter n=1 Tax=Ensifer sp. SSB1 TaxID=2795385 RepID=UPI001A5C989B|nr:Nramp family divalent metal transporter [Ensifer sp. SSB1]MBK5570889.1 Nramp family divalent metal transporter [Ensifer sp. SSB1]